MLVSSIAIIKLALISLFGFFLYRRKIVSDTTLKFLSSFVINWSVPFLFFSHLISQAQIVVNHNLGTFLFLSLVIFLVGFLIGLALTWRKDSKFKKEIISLISFQNSGYLPMNIAVFLFLGKTRETFLVYTFLYLLGFNIIIWSLGSFLIFKEKKQKLKLKSLLNPPAVSTLLALLFIYTNTAKFLPALIIEPMKMVGETTFVISMIVLGCFLGKINLDQIRHRFYDMLVPSLVRLLLIPCIFFIVLLKLKITSLLGTFLIIQAAMPCAVSLPIIAQIWSADSELISQGVFLSHLMGILTVPIWFYIMASSGFTF